MTAHIELYRRKTNWFSVALWDATFNREENLGSYSCLYMVLY